jgi:antirestriction protein
MLTYLAIRHDKKDGSVIPDDREIASIEMEESETVKQVQKWIDKMTILGYEVEYESCRLSDIDVRFGTDIEYLSLPCLAYIDADAFIGLGVKEVKITSPITLIQPGAEYKNKHNRPIKISYAYDETNAEQDHFKDTLANFYINSILFWQDAVYTTGEMYNLKTSVDI